MRIDKFLKNARLIKRRTVAREACLAGRVLLNGLPAKPGASVSPGDIILIRFGQSELTVRVVRLAEHVPADQAASLYEAVEEQGEK